MPCIILRFIKFAGAILGYFSAFPGAFVVETTHLLLGVVDLSTVYLYSVAYSRCQEIITAAASSVAVSQFPHHV
jgi:hypothetical protein